MLTPKFCTRLAKIKKNWKTRGNNVLHYLHLLCRKVIFFLTMMYILFHGNLPSKPWRWMYLCSGSQVKGIVWCLLGTCTQVSLLASTTIFHVLTLLSAEFPFSTGCSLLKDSWDNNKIQLFKRMFASLGHFYSQHFCGFSHTNNQSSNSPDTTIPIIQLCSDTTYSGLVQALQD